LKDVAILSLDTGMRVGEARTLEWADVHLEPVNGAKFGYIHIRSGKSRNAKRNVLITPRVREMLGGRRAEAKTRYVFPSEAGTGPVSTYTLEAQHSRVRKAQGLDGYVIHSFRHTFGTRLGESGADAFSIMKAMAHSSVTISQRYVHPTPEAMERVWTRLNDLNQKAVASLPAITLGRQKPATMKSEVPTLVPTVRESGLSKASAYLQ
jgi:integrase